MNAIGAIMVDKCATSSLKRYVGPAEHQVTSLKKIMADTGRPPLEERQLGLLQSGAAASDKTDVKIYFAGNLELLDYRCVSIVGTRDVTPQGRSRASRLAKHLALRGIVVVSGLAKGIDTAAMAGSMDNGGHTVGVIGTPLSKAYPAENAAMQEAVWRNHLLMTPFRDGETVYRSNFPKRNRVMAAVSDATVIVEASDTSGTLHQAAECQRLGRWLFIMKSVVDDTNLSWPANFLGKPNTAVLSHPDEIVEILRPGTYR